MSEILLADRAEQAFVNLIEPAVRTLLGVNAAAAVPVVVSKDSTARNGYQVTARVDVGEEDVRYTGNHWCVATIEVQTPGIPQPGDRDSARLPNLNLLSTVNTVLTSSTLEAQLTAAVQAPTTFTLRSAGESDVNGTYTKVDAEHWSGPNGSSIVLFENLWQIYNQFAVVLYTCTPELFPFGPWSIASGAAPVPRSNQSAPFSEVYGGLHVFEQSLTHLGSERMQHNTSLCWKDLIQIRFLACASDLS